MDGGAPVELRPWARWEVPICFVILAAPAAASAATISRVRIDPLKPRDLWIQSWKRMSPLWLLTLRAFALFALCWLLLEMVLLDGAFAFYFYTQLPPLYLPVAAGVIQSISLQMWKTEGYLKGMLKRT